ncbi:MAG TPA: hypothetical protein VFU15_02620 [Bacteroidia bacterium]|nr:hypothetical protein [Bacteroidia bacterium]
MDSGRCNSVLEESCCCFNFNTVFIPSLNPAMKTPFRILLPIILIQFISCGPSAQERAEVEKAKMDSTAHATIDASRRKNDSMVSSQVNVLDSEIVKQQREIYRLENDPDYLYVKTRLATVRARVSTGGSYGWIDKDGKFWEGKDASAAFDAAAKEESDQLKKIDVKNAEIKSLQDQIQNLQALKSDR